jgi:hypothetical protein
MYLGFPREYITIYIIHWNNATCLFSFEDLTSETAKATSTGLVTIEGTWVRRVMGNPNPNPKP